MCGYGFPVKPVPHSLSSEKYSLARVALMNCDDEACSAVLCNVLMVVYAFVDHVGFLRRLVPGYPQAAEPACG